MDWLSPQEHISLHIDRPGYSEPEYLLHCSHTGAIHRLRLPGDGLTVALETDADSGLVYIEFSDDTIENEWAVDVMQLSLKTDNISLTVMSPGNSSQMLLTDLLSRHTTAMLATFMKMCFAVGRHTGRVAHDGDRIKLLGLARATPC
jgi:hypothetical protein